MIALSSPKVAVAVAGGRVRGKKCIRGRVRERDAYM